MQQETFKKIGGGLALGAANSIFGGGGGMLAVPLLRSFRLSEREAHATAILVILPVCIASLFLYFFKGLYDTRVLIPTALGVTAGGMLGANILNAVSGKTAAVVFAVLQLVAGVWLMI
ncbi:MAG: sulfite exporter TauE/SafE family protein [Clostridia bacterium]|nr:sulfite exporter TauE/SafE family protein [Clostridia bacterium]